MYLYTVRDKKAETFGPPFSQQNDVTALRAFSQEINRQHEANVLYTNPDDFELYLVGEFDNHTGKLVALKMKIVGTGKAVKEKK